MKKMIIALAAVLAASLSLAPSAAVAQDGQLTAGIEGDYPPWAWVEGGEPKGIAIDAMKALAKDQGLDVKFVDLPWPALIPAVADGKIDLLVTGVSVTEERSQIIAFTIPWYEANDVIVVPADSDKNIFTAVCCGSKIGVHGGSTNHKWLMANVESAPDLGAEIKPYGDVLTAVSDLLAGRLDSVNLSETTAEDLISNGREIKVVGGMSTRLPMAMAVPKSDPKDLLAKLNRGLLNIYESCEWGTILHSYMPNAKVVQIPAAMPEYIDGYGGPIPGIDN